MKDMLDPSGKGWLRALAEWSRRLGLRHDAERLRQLSEPVARRLQNVTRWYELEPGDGPLDLPDRGDGANR